MTYTHHAISLMNCLPYLLRSTKGLLYTFMLCSFLLTLPVSAWSANSSNPTIIVTTEQDIFDGDTHSPESLKKFPGRDKAISLREAIETANQSPEQVTILFQSPNETMTFTIQSALPSISKSLIIDGTTPQAPDVILKGPGNASASEIDGLILKSNQSIIRGLTITSFPGNGIVIQGSENRLEHNYIGTDALGRSDKGNGFNGVLVLGNSNQIGGSSHEARNVISGNMGHGIAIQKGKKNRVIGNLIGLHPRRDQALPNAKDGIFIAGSYNIIGGNNSLDTNIISGNRKNGIHLMASAHHTRIQGNLVGIHSSLQHLLPNQEDGIFVKSQDNLIGGAQTGAGNIIGGNSQSGIEIHQGHNNQIQGNFIGTNMDGTLDWGNQLEGIVIFANNTQVGGNQAHTSNRIAFNKRGGVAIPFGQGNTIQGNAIYQNKGLAINLLQDNLTPNDLLDQDLGPNDLQNFPILLVAAAHSTNDLFVAGQLNSQSTQTYKLDFYAGKPDGPLRYQEAFAYLGSETVTTNANGETRFSFHLPKSTSPGRYITATATNREGATSELAHSILVDRPNPQIIWNEIDTSAKNPAIFHTSYSEGMAPVGLLPSTLEIKDVDSPQLSQLTVTLSNPLDGEMEVVAANLSPPLSQSYVQGILTITGKAPLARYEEVLRSLTYQNISVAPTTAPRLLTIVASDGEFMSQPFTTHVSIEGVNTPPMLTWQTSASTKPSTHYTTAFTEGDTPVHILPDTVTLTDLDSPQLTQVTIAMDHRLDGKEEILHANLIDPTLQQTFSGKVLTISGLASIEAYEAALGSLTYKNRSPTPTVTPRVLTILTSDGMLTSQPFTTTITIDAVNTPPTMTWSQFSSTSSPQTYTTSYREGADPILILPQTTMLTDLDSKILNQLTVTLENPLDGKHEVLDVPLRDRSLRKIFQNGTLTISGPASLETYQTLLRSVTYENRSVAPTVTPRVITTVASDGMHTSQPLTTTVRVDEVNTPPTVTWQTPSLGHSPSTYTSSYKEGSNPISLVPNTTTLTDQDSTVLHLLTVALKNPLDGAQEVLDVDLNDDSLKKIFQNGTLTISGPASLETYQTLLRSVTYENRSVAPSTTPRLFSIVASDEGLSSTPQITQVNLVAHNTPPSLTVSSVKPNGPLTFTEGDDSMALISDHSHIEDQDSSTFQMLKVALTDPLDQDQEVLSAQLPESGLTQTYQQGTLTVRGKASKTVYESVLHSLTYRNQQIHPQEGERDITFSIQDSQGSISQAQKMTISVKTKPHVQEPFAKPFIASLDSVAEHVKAEAQEQQAAKQLVVKTVTGSSLMVTAGLFIWVLRGTSLLASIWATIPAWNSIDPLPILGMSQEERLQELVDTQHIEAQEQQEFPQIQEIFSQQPTAPPSTEKDPPLA